MCMANVCTCKDKLEMEARPRCLPLPPQNVPTRARQLRVHAALSPVSPVHREKLRAVQGESTVQ